MVSLAELESAAQIVYRSMPPTPQYSWPLVNQRAGAEIWVKHENHTPVGAFKVRGGLVYMDWLAREHPEVKAVISATRGNHGQSLAFAGKAKGIAVTIVVPKQNGTEKNAAMRALGAELIVNGDDFQEAAEFAEELADSRGQHRVPSFHLLLVRGVGTYALEFFRAAPPLDAVYVPVGMGSGICGMVAARDALGLKTRIIGVASSGAPALALSFLKKSVVPHVVTTVLADGMACRLPDANALQIMLGGVERFVQVSEQEVAGAMKALYEDTHNVAEGAGAASLAAILQEKEQVAGKRIGCVISGANAGRQQMADVLEGQAN